MKMDVTEQEWQLIECLREDHDKFRLIVERQDGAWETTMSVPPQISRGIGATFAAAWDDMAPIGL